MGRRSLEMIVNLCKRRGIIFPSAEHYGGLGAVYDFGPLGTFMKEKVKQSWWRHFVTERKDVFPVDTSILTHSAVLNASGHISNFVDPLSECKNCHFRFRTDHLPSHGKCPHCGISDWTPPVQFNLLFETSLGAAEGSKKQVYLRPETAQGIFLALTQVRRAMRASLPFGISSVGKSFRNEVSPSSFIFRSREFEQMEIEYFVGAETNVDECVDSWVQHALNFFEHTLGIPSKQLRTVEIESGDRAHYSSRTVDIEFEWPWGWGELAGVANRGVFDLQSHRIGPACDDVCAVIEPSLGVERSLLAALIASLPGGNESDDERALHLPWNLCAYDVALLPLVRKDAQQNRLLDDYYRDASRAGFTVATDLTGSIGKRYRRQDEIGTLFAVTIDHESVERDGAVTIRHRDSMAQVRLDWNRVLATFRKWQGSNGVECWKELESIGEEVRREG